MEFHYIASLNLNQLIFGCWKESVSRPVNVCKHSIQIRLRFDFRFWSSFLYKLSHTHTARTEINTRAKFELQTILRQRQRFCHFFSLTLSLSVLGKKSFGVFHGSLFSGEIHAIREKSRSIRKLKHTLTNGTRWTLPSKPKWKISLWEMWGRVCALNL